MAGVGDPGVARDVAGAGRHDGGRRRAVRCRAAISRKGGPQTRAGTNIRGLRPAARHMYHEMFVTVPLLDLHAQYTPLRQAVLDAVTRVCDSQRFIGGPEVEGLERELCAHLDVPHAIGLSSGTDAVLAALMALDIGPGDEVITPTYSFFATAGCVVRVGAKPVLVDIEPGTFNIDVDATLAAITPRTRAIIPVHLFGQAAELAPIVEMAQPARHCGHRRCGAGDRLPLSRPPGRHVGRDRLLLVFSEQESRRVRRRRVRDHDRRRPGEEAEADSHARHGAEVLPSPGRRQLPHRCDPGRGAARQAAAPAGVERRAPRQRGALSRALCRCRP